MKTCRNGMVGEALAVSALFAILFMPAQGLAQTSESDVDFPRSAEVRCRSQLAEGNSTRAGKTPHDIA